MKADRKWIERGKNLLIVLLAISAVCLAIYGQWSTRVTMGEEGKNPLSAWLGEEEHWSGLPEGEALEISSKLSFYPLRIAVLTESGICGIQYDAEQIRQSFDGGVRLLLSEGIGSAGPAFPTDGEHWRRALEGRGVYLEFPGNVPVLALAYWLNVETVVQNVNFHRILLSLENGTVKLYYETDRGDCFVCETAVSAAALEAELNRYQPNSAAFAYALGYESMDEGVLLLPQTPQRTMLAASAGAGTEEEVERLLKLLEFNPYTESRYLTTGGTQVINEVDRSLRIERSGWVRYRTGGEGEEETLRIAASGEYPNVQELIGGTWTLAEATVGVYAGEAELYFLGLEEQPEEGTVTVRFGLSWDGSPIYATQDGAQAVFVIRDRAIQSMDLLLRSYSKGEGESLILPEEQAEAALSALGGQNVELLLGYEDNGSARLSAGWIAGQ